MILAPAGNTLGHQCVLAAMVRPNLEKDSDPRLLDFLNPPPIPPHSVLKNCL